MSENTSKIKINPKILIGIYGVMPLSVIFILIDNLLLSSHIQKSLPLDPRVFVWFILIFMVPHIIASFFSFADYEYFEFYKQKLLRGAQIAVGLGIFIPTILGSTVIPLVIFASYTMVHVFMQQSGISKSLMRNVDSYHKYWQALGIGIAIVIYVYLLVPATSFQQFIHDNIFIKFVLIFSMIIYSYFAYRIASKSKTVLGKVYFLGSHMIPIMGIVYILSGYPTIALIVPRVIHDLTAFTYYITHDNNRHKSEKSNYIYRITDKLKLPIFLANPLLSISFAFMIVRLDSTVILSILTCVFFLHYYTESLIWKSDTLHRNQIGYLPFK